MSKRKKLKFTLLVENNKFNLYLFYRTVLFSLSHFTLPFLEFVLSFTALVIFANNIRSLGNIHAYFQLLKLVTGRFLLLHLLLHLGNFAGWIWTSYFVHGVKYMILSGSFARWYWTMDKDKIPKNSVHDSMTAVRK